MDYQTTLRAPFGILVLLLGKPVEKRELPEKCSTMWCVDEDGEEIVIKDRQEDDPTFKVSVFRALPYYDWAVTASSERVATAFCRSLSAKVIAKLAEIKTLTSEAKAEVNRLLREGVSLEEAMRRVPPQSPTELVQRYRWPIED